jgi:hypothetical protein
MINKESLYEWVFHYNHYTELWSAFQRKDYAQYFNDPSDPNLMVIKSKEVKTLIDILYRINGDENKIAEL